MHRKEHVVSDHHVAKSGFVASRPSWRLPFVLGFAPRRRTCTHVAHDDEPWRIDKHAPSDGEDRIGRRRGEEGRRTDDEAGRSRCGHVARPRMEEILRRRKQAVQAHLAKKARTCA